LPIMSVPPFDFGISGRRKRTSREAPRDARGTTSVREST
jgi:hypothetical protein